MVGHSCPTTERSDLPVLGKNAQPTSILFHLMVLSTRLQHEFLSAPRQLQDELIPAFDPIKPESYQ